MPQFDTFIFHLLRMELLCAGLICIVLLLRSFLLHRMPKGFFLSLWGLTLVRLLLPVSVASPLSLPGLFPFSQPVRFSTAERVVITAAGDFVITGSNAAQPILLIPAIVWGAGSLIAGMLFGLLYIRTNLVLRQALPWKETEWYHILCREYPLLRRYRVYVSDQIHMPLACGVLRPRIVLPSSLDLSDQDRMAHVLLHEAVHLHSLHNLWKLIMLAAVCLHWWNPLVWVMYRVLSKDLELACDAEVLREIGLEERARYAKSVLDLAEEGAGFSTPYNGFSHHTVNTTTERIVSIVHLKRSTLLTLLLAGVLFVFTASVFAADKHKAMDTYGQKYSVVNATYVTTGTAGQQETAAYSGEETVITEDLGYAINMSEEVITPSAAEGASSNYAEETAVTAIEIAEETSYQTSERISDKSAVDIHLKFNPLGGN